MPTRPVFLYCVIAVLLNGVVALGWRLWYEVKYAQKQAEQIYELEIQLEGAFGSRAAYFA